MFFFDEAREEEELWEELLYFDIYIFYHQKLKDLSYFLLKSNSYCLPFPPSRISIPLFKIGITTLAYFQ